MSEKLRITMDVFPRANEVTLNGRVYPQEAIDKMYTQIQNQIDEGKCMLFHPRAIEEMEGTIGANLVLSNIIGKIEKIEDDNSLTGFISEEMFNSRFSELSFSKNDFQTMKALIKESKMIIMPLVMGVLEPGQDGHSNVTEIQFLGVTIIPRNMVLPEKLNIEDDK